MEDLPAAQAFCTFLTDFLFSNFIFFTYDNMGSLKKIVIHYIQVHGCSGQRYAEDVYDRGSKDRMQWSKLFHCGDP